MRWNTLLDCRYCGVTLQFNHYNSAIVFVILSRFILILCSKEIRSFCP
jgi:hypothetical protein